MVLRKKNNCKLLYIKLKHVRKVLFIKIHCIVDWNSISKSHVHQDSWHCGLEQCNDRDALATERCKDCRGRVGLSFYWDVFGIKDMVWKKTVSANFGGA